MRESFKKLVPKIIGKYLNTLSYISPSATKEKAFDLFSKPRRGAIGEHHTPFLDPAKDTIINLNDLKLQTYHWPGKGKTVLLVHGWESHSHRWKMLIEELQKKDFNIYAFDAPAHGYSTGSNLYVPLYRQALEEVISYCSPSLIISHSVGAMTALYHLSQNNDHAIEKAVILGPPDDLNSILKEYRSILGLSQRVMNQMDQYFLERFGFRSDAFAGSIFAEKIKIPGLIIHDKDDRITSCSGSQNIHKHWENSQLVVTEGLNHSLYSDDVNETIIKYISA